MDNGILVSVVVPTYNRAGIVSRAIDSILKQSYPRVEVVVVNDGSTDNTTQILKDAQKKDARVTYRQNTKSKGCAGARNTGVSVATGDYITFLDDDDEYYPDKIIKDLDIFMDNPGVDVVVSGVSVKWSSVGSRNVDWIGLEFHPHRIFDGCRIMCKRAVLEKVGFRCGYMEWRDFAFQIYENGFTVFLHRENLVRKNSSTGSLSKHEEAMLTSALDNAKCYYEYSRGKEEHVVFKHYLANCYKNIGNLSLKRGLVWRAICSYANSYLVERKTRNLVPFT